MELICTAEDCSINKYIGCKFNQKYHILLIGCTGKYEDLTEEQLAACLNAFDSIETEFVDAMGVHIQEIVLLREIHAMQCRNTAVQNYLQVYYDHAMLFKEAPEKWFHYIEKYYRLTWNGDIQNFISQLDKIRKKEVPHALRLKTKMQELEAYQKLQQETPTAETSKKQFMSFVNSLLKNGFPIDFEKTSMYQLGVMSSDLAYMQKQMLKDSVGRR